MGEPVIHRRELHVGNLPTVVFGHRSLIWWGTIGMMAIEGTMFAIVIAAYFYLRTRISDWPPGVMPPALIYGLLNTAVYLVSVIPNQWTKSYAEKGDRGKVQVGLVVMTLVGIVNIVLRGFEFTALNCQWDANAYASILWILIGLHTAHLLTDWVDTVVLTVLFFTGPLDGKRYMDASENSDYWYFVVITWLPIWFVIYIAPRLL
jgi:heme/copper-type cytochrome/quinol oxidase subunit 3